MKFGLKVHHSDVDSLLSLNPEALEYVLFEDDLAGGWRKPASFTGEVIVHAPEKYRDGELVDLGAEDVKERKRAVEVLKRTIDISSKLGAKYAICHPGGVYATQREADMSGLIESTVELVEYSGGRVDVLLENMPGIYWYEGELRAACLFNDWKQIREVLKATGTGLCLDICHAKLYCNMKNLDFNAYVKVLKPYVRHIHVSDALGVSGEGVQVGDGEMDFKALLSALKGLDVVMVPEILNGHKNAGSGFKAARNRLTRLGFYSQQGFV